MFADKAAIPTELRCAMCKEPWWADSAVACPGCEEIFCRPCIESHLAKASKCPSCESDLDVKDLQRPPRALRSMSGCTPVLCPNRPRGCWTGPWAELESHLKVCPFDPAKLVYAEDVNANLQCPVCLEPLRQPEACGLCEELFCGPCIRRSLQGNPACPHCREALSPELLKEAPKKVVGLLDRLKVKCVAGCGWVGARAEYDGHLKECAHRLGVAAPAAAVATPPAAAVATPPAAAVATPPAAPAAAGAPAQPLAAVTGSAQVTVAAHTFHPQLQAADKPTTFTAMAHVTAPKIEAAAGQKRRDLQIAAVMDISGSMEGEKLQLAKEALSFVVNELGAQDRFGLIAFDDRVEERCAAAAMDTAGKDTALAAVARLKDRGSTNLSGGLFAGIAQARDMPFASAEMLNVIGATNRVPRSVATSAHAAPAAAGILGRMSARFFGSSAPPSYSPATHGAPAPVNVTMRPKSATVQPVPAFDLRVSHNATPMKQDGKWLARYTFSLDSALPAGVDRVAVAHKTRGEIALRGQSTFGLLEDPKAAFTVRVLYKATAHPTQEFPLVVDSHAEDPTGTTVFHVPEARAPAPTPVSNAAQRSRIVLLFTDGEANAGITDPSELVARTRQILDAMPDKDVTVFTFGFGAGHNASLLKQIAEASQGSYYFVERAGQIKEIFADCLGGLLSIAATNLVLTIKPAFGIRLKRVRTQFPQTASEDGSVAVRIKDMYAEESRDVVVELEVAPRAAGATAPVVHFALACDNVLTGAAQQASATAAVPTAEGAYTGEPDVLVAQQLARLELTDAMEAATKLADAGKVSEARNRIQAARADLLCNASAGTAYTQALQVQLAEAEECTKSESVWRSHGQKKVSQWHGAHMQQRCNDVDDECDAPAMYATSAKMALRSKAKK